MISRFNLVLVISILFGNSALAVECPKSHPQLLINGEQGVEIYQQQPTGLLTYRFDPNVGFGHLFDPVRMAKPDPKMTVELIKELQKARSDIGRPLELVLTASYAFIQDRANPVLVWEAFNRFVGTYNLVLPNRRVTYFDGPCQDSGGKEMILIFFK